MLISLRRKDKSLNLEKIRILTSDEYNKFFGINVAGIKRYIVKQYGRL